MEDENSFIIEFNNNNIINNTQKITIEEIQIKDNDKIKFNKDQIVNYLYDLASEKSFYYYDLFFPNNNVINRLNYVNPVADNKLYFSTKAEDEKETKDDLIGLSFNEDINIEENGVEFRENLRSFMNDNVDNYINKTSAFYNLYTPFEKAGNNDISKYKLDVFCSLSLITYRRYRLLEKITTDTGHRSELIDNKEGCQSGLNYLNKPNYINIINNEKINLIGLLYHYNNLETEIFSLNKYFKYLDKLEINQEVDIYFNDFVFNEDGDEIVEILYNAKIVDISENLITIDLKKNIYINSKLTNKIICNKNKYKSFFIYGSTYPESNLKYRKIMLKRNSNIYFHFKQPYKSSYEKYINPSNVSELLYIYYINGCNLNSIYNIKMILKKHNIDLDIFDKKMYKTLLFLLQDNIETIYNSINEPGFKIIPFRTDNVFIKKNIKFKNLYIDSNLARTLSLNNQIDSSNYFLLNLLEDNKSLVRNLLFQYNEIKLKDKLYTYEELIKLSSENERIKINEDQNKNKHSLKNIIKYYNYYNILVSNVSKIYKNKEYAILLLRNKTRLFKPKNIKIDYSKYHGNMDEIDFDMMYNNLDYAENDIFISEQLPIFVDDEDEGDINNIFIKEKTDDDILTFFVTELDIQIGKTHLNYIYTKVNNIIDKNYVNVETTKYIKELEKKYKTHRNKFNNNIKRELKLKNIKLNEHYNDIYTLNCVSYLILFILNKYPSLNINKINPKYINNLSYTKSLTKYFSLLIHDYSKLNDIRFVKFENMNVNNIELELIKRTTELLQENPELKSNVTKDNIIVADFNSYKNVNLLYKPNKMYNINIKSKIKIDKTISLIPKLIIPKQKKEHILNIKLINTVKLSNVKKENRKKRFSNIEEIYESILNSNENIITEDIDIMLSRILNNIEISEYLKNIIYPKEIIPNTSINFYMFLKSALLNSISLYLNNQIEDITDYVTIDIMKLYNDIIRKYINLNSTNQYYDTYQIHLNLFILFLRQLYENTTEESANILIAYLLKDCESFMILNDSRRDYVKEKLEIVREEDKVRKMNKNIDNEDRKMNMMLKKIGFNI